MTTRTQHFLQAGHFLLILLMLCGLPVLLHADNLHLPATNDVTPGRALFVCTNRVYEMGTVSRTQAVDRTFLIRNNGEFPLIISHVQACCGLSVTLGQTNISSNGSTDLRVTLKPGQGPGFVRKTIYLHTNDPEAKIVALRLSATIQSGPAPPAAAVSPVRKD